MKPTGKGQKDILIIGEAGGKQEDNRGEQFIGKTGKTLRGILKEKGIDLDIDCRKMNALSCCPPKNRNPSASEIKYCRPNVWKEINEFKPRVIILLGKAAVESVIGYFWKKDLGGITKWRGWAIPDQKLKAWICPTYPPSYLNYEKNPVLKKIFASDVENAIKMVDYSFPDFGDENKKIKIIKNTEDIVKGLENILEKKPSLLTYDYETTGLKPHAKGHEIVCCSISTDPDSAISFPMKSNKVKAVFRNILANPDIKKIAANMKFEESWNRFKLKQKCKNWIWDTMLATHVLDNRQGITSLKFQTYIRYGLANYDSHISSFLEADDEKDGANSFNKIHKTDLNELLLYCGIDSMMEHRLAMDQIKEMGIADPKEFAKTGHISNFETLIYKEPKPIKKVKRK